MREVQFGASLSA